ncbi:MAG: long-chain-acyl-CoA synthetase, partial [Deltaproteobacteria bacterium]|nr:long-chain-acyl-CoA synthetase [Deltaproteobacteria bacterium]
MSLQRLRTLGRSLRWLPGVLAAGPNSKRTTADLIEKRAARQPDDVFLRFEGRDVSYADYNAACNRVAHWGLAKGLGKGDVVALLMENRPEYLQVWGGLAKAGATTALLNTSLSGQALAHVLRASECRALVIGRECLDAWQSLGIERPTDLPVYVVDDSDVGTALPPATKSFDQEVSGYSPHDPPRAVRSALRGADALFYIYTSGTTGLPKAARFSHARFMGGGTFSLLNGFGRDDVLYCPLPLYHTVGGVMCVNAVLRSGATLALRRRFSAKAFWRDICETGATTFQYIGEICRYLLAQPESEWDRGHQVRFCVGNGLRPDVWSAFQERFAIPRISEFYGATESNVAMLNLDNRTGSIGKPMPGTKVALVRWDVENDAHVHDGDGKLVPCSDDEPGELLGRISEGPTAAGRFEGYTSRRDSEKKILRDVFEPGDAWFRSGDLLRRDKAGFYYFVDRLGDTFRWKGENVSSQEVAQVVDAFPGVELSAVYGVEVPGADGRAGMAGLVLEPGASFDAQAFCRHATTALPAYARPAFVRLLPQAELTGTFKVRKVELQQQGFDPAATDDALFVRDET